MKIESFKRALPYLMNARIATLVWGHHGVGKSQAVKQFCEENEIGFIDLRLSTQEVGDLLGLADFVEDANGKKVATKFMRPEWFPVDPKSKGIIFLDELNRAPRDVLQAVFQLVLDRRIHTYELPEGWYVVAASNPNTESYVVTDIGDKAFMDRFCHISMKPSVQEWVSYARLKEFDPGIIDFINTQPEQLQEALEEDPTLQQVKPSRRSWEMVNKLIKVGAPIDILQELCFGLLGSATTIAFMESMKSSEKPFSAVEILNDYTKIAKKVKKYGTLDKEGSNRFDLLRASSDNLENYIQKHVKEENNKLEPKQAKNLVSYLYDLPRDLGFAVLHEIYQVEGIRDYLDNDKRVLKIVDEARKDQTEKEKTA